MRARPPTAHPILRLIVVALVFAGSVRLRASGQEARADDATTSDVVMLERMIIEATGPAKRPGLLGMFDHEPTWRYVRSARYEILSQCDQAETDAVARHLADSLAMLENFVPGDHLAPPVTPMSFIMFNRIPSKAMDALIPSEFVETDYEPQFGRDYRGFPTVTVGGRDIDAADTHCVVQNRAGLRWRWAGGGLGHGPIPTGLLFQLSRCRPSLPRWYCYGFIGPCGLLRMVPGKKGEILAQATWISEDETSRMLAEAKRSGVPPALPPIEELFDRPSEAETRPTTAWPPAAWMAEASLFLRWGLFGGDAHRAAFDRFVERSRTEPVTEAMFRECFGFGYAAIQAELSRYLVKAARKPIAVPFATLARERVTSGRAQAAAASLSSREATPGEIARMLGDWERMEGEARRTENPALAAVFFRQAGKTLRRAYDNNERDPRLLAVLGLYEIDAGAEAKARPLLEAAVAAGVERPAAWIALAQLRYDEAVAHPAAADGRLDAKQLAAVLAPLFSVRKTAGLSAAGYRLIAEAWARSDTRPASSHLEVLREGVARYPFDSALLVATAGVYAQWDYAEEAGALIDRRIGFADAAARAQLAALRASLPVVR